MSTFAVYSGNTDCGSDFMDIFKKYISQLAIPTVRRVILLSVCFVVSVLGTASAKPAAEATADFDSLLHLSKGMSVDQIRHKGRSVFLEQKDPHTALLWYRTALKRPTDNFTADEWESLARIYSNIGHIYYYEYGNAQQALVSLMNSAGICEAHGRDNDGFALTDIYYTFADIYTSYNDLSKASYYLKKGFDVSLRKDIRKIGYSFANLAWISILNDSVPSIRRERELFRRAEVPDTSVLVRFCRQILGAMDHIDNNDYAAASRLADIALTDRTFATPDNPDITILRYHAIALLISSHLRLKINDVPGTAKRLSEAETIITPNGLFDLYDFLYKEKAAYLRLTGNTSRARDCEFRAMKVRDSLYNSHKYGLLRNIEEEWKVSEMENRLKQNEAERQILIIKQNKQQTIMLTLGVSAVAILLMLLWIFRKNRMLRETNASLFYKNIELADALSSSSPVFVRTVQAAHNNSPDSDSEDCRMTPTNDTDGRTEPGTKKKDCTDEAYTTFERIRQIMAENREIYNPDFTIETLSHISGIHSRRLSQAINSFTGKSFSTFVGEYRIAEACRQLTAPGIRPTIAAVAENVGYKSRTHFSTVFKAVTGMTTTEFIRQANRSLENRL